MVSLPQNLGFTCKKVYFSVNFVFFGPFLGPNWALFGPKKNFLRRFFSSSVFKIHILSIQSDITEKDSPEMKKYLHNLSNHLKSEYAPKLTKSWQNRDIPLSRKPVGFVWFLIFWPNFFFKHLKISFSFEKSW